MQSCMNAVYQYAFNGLGYTQRDREWYMMHGSIVRARDKANLHEHLCDASMHINDFYAYNVNGDLWEVQFSKDPNPSVVVLVKAKSGYEASIFARTSLLQDRDKLQVVHVSS